MEGKTIEEIVFNVCDVLSKEQEKIWETDKPYSEKLAVDKALNFAQHIIQRKFGII